MLLLGLLLFFWGVGGRGRFPEEDLCVQKLQFVVVVVLCFCICVSLLLVSACPCSLPQRQTRTDRHVDGRTDRHKDRQVGRRAG